MALFLVDTPQKVDDIHRAVFFCVFLHFFLPVLVSNAVISCFSSLMHKSLGCHTVVWKVASKNSRRHHWFLLEMTSDKRARKFRTYEERLRLSRQ